MKNKASDSFMNLPNFSQVQSAAKLLQKQVIRTPLLQNEHLNNLCKAQIFIKPESLQYSGSFKFRGAFNAMCNLPNDKKQRGIIAASSGNHAQGIALAAKLLKLKCSIIMPKDAPKIKINNTKNFGAKIIFYNRKDNRDELLEKIAKQTNAYPIHPFNNKDVIAGQGTVGLEIAEDLKQKKIKCDHVLAPTGGGGLIAGISLAMKHFFPKCAIHTVEPKNYDDYAKSLKIKKRQAIKNKQAKTICDAIVTPMAGEISFAIGKKLFAKGLVVNEGQVLHAMQYALQTLKLVVEPAGCVALAALLHKKLAVKNKVIVIVLSGGNMDNEILIKAIKNKGKS